MPKGASTVALVLMLSLAQLASADVIYTYTGNPFTDISGPWNLAFGSDPTEITVTIDVPNPFPTQSQFFGFPCGSFGSTFVYPGIGTPGIPGDSISDGLRTFAPDVVYLDGCGTTIQHWKIAGGFYALQPNSDDRAMYTSNVVSPQTAVGTGDVTIYTQIINFFTGPIYEDGAFGPANGTWTAVVTPEVSTGVLGLISGSLLLLGYWRRRR